MSRQKLFMFFGLFSGLLLVVVGCWLVSVALALVVGGVLWAALIFLFTLEVPSEVNRQAG